MNKIEFSNGSFTYKILFDKDDGYYIKRFNKLGDLDIESISKEVNKN